MRSAPRLRGGETGDPAAPREGARQSAHGPGRAERAERGCAREALTGDGAGAKGGQRRAEGGAGRGGASERQGGPGRRRRFRAWAGGAGPGARTGGALGADRGAGRGRRACGRHDFTSLSGTHCGSSRPNGLPKARCSGTMRRPLGERTSFLASLRAATSEDITPPQRSPAALTRALAPPKAPPRSCG